MTYIFLVLLILFFISGFIYLYKKRPKTYTIIGKFITTYFFIGIVVALVFSIVLFPRQSVNAAYNGLMVWFTIVLPALLPFFIGSELLIRLGVIKFIGALLEPMMRPLFNVPGTGSFAFAMSITSGYPVGAKIVSRLRLNNEISRIEAQRLIAFCSTSGPLFMIGAVSVGMFRSAELGILIALTHYLSIILIGILFRFYKSKHDLSALKQKKYSPIRNAFIQLRDHQRNSPPIGIHLGNAVRESINTMLLVGGFIILFSVIIEILKLIGFISFFARFISLVLIPFNLDVAYIEALITGLFEITMGCKMLSEVYTTDLILKIAAASFIISWSGFSIHAQCISIISETDINTKLYMLSKFFHGLLSFVLTIIIYPIFIRFFDISTKVSSYYDYLNTNEKIFLGVKSALEVFVTVVGGLLILSILCSGVLLIKNKLQKRG
ncbi:sporulation integral membrane protein YlbJ [Serpentinicella alkaliphila]|uniref:Sporulation integral membrane protein YlbJ n=1 Tax=Serpentinicella alkaliphila TaxID=1734049 RepID=A0A4R2THJ8_9FIRM|nr:sporulation integral membrane protein YlbJ [Serpentinicella alkaliphila]QUH26231.1 sporulation integral membrane protein YlbJ [Serpentinicella alkaliphila]TCQ01692.1 sporulation integral membrane protein YlbJ [Serpentinicella alkaliphila]